MVDNFKWITFVQSEFHKNLNYWNISERIWYFTRIEFKNKKKIEKCWSRLTDNRTAVVRNISRNAVSPRGYKPTLRGMLNLQPEIMLIRSSINRWPIQTLGFTSRHLFRFRNADRLFSSPMTNWSENNVRNFVFVYFSGLFAGLQFVPRPEPVYAVLVLILELVNRVRRVVRFVNWYFSDVRKILLLLSKCGFFRAL